MAGICFQRAPGQDLAQNGRFPGIPEGSFNCKAPSHQSPKIWLQTAPSQDLAQKGRFSGIPEGNFNCGAPSHQNPKIWLQKAPGQALAQKGRFPGIPEGSFNCRATSHQSPKLWLQKAPGQDLAQTGRFPGIPEGSFNCKAPGHQSPKIWLQKVPGSGLAQEGRFPGIPEGSFNCKAPSHQSPKIWLQKAPGQDLAQKGRFPGIPEGSFNCSAPSHQTPKFGPALKVPFWDQWETARLGQIRTVSLLEATFWHLKAMCQAICAQAKPHGLGPSGFWQCPPSSVPRYLEPGTGVAQAKPHGLGPSGFWQCPPSSPKGTVPSYLRPGTGAGSAPSHQNPKIRLQKLLAKIHCAALFAARDRGRHLQPGTGVAQAKPHGLGPSGFWQCPPSSPKGTVPSYLRPGTGAAHAKTPWFALKRVLAIFWGSSCNNLEGGRRKKKAPLERGVWGGENSKPVKRCKFGWFGVGPRNKTGASPLRQMTRGEAAVVL